MDTKQKEAPTAVATAAKGNGTDRLRDPNAWDRMWRTVDRIRERNAHHDPDEVMRHVTEVVEEVRQERYERERRAAADGR